MEYLREIIVNTIFDEINVISKSNKEDVTDIDCNTEIRNILNSLDLVTLIVNIETKYDIILDEGAINKMTIDSLSHAVTKLMEDKKIEEQRIEDLMENIFEEE